MLTPRPRVSDGPRRPPGRAICRRIRAPTLSRNPGSTTRAAESRRRIRAGRSHPGCIRIRARVLSCARRSSREAESRRTCRFRLASRPGRHALEDAPFRAIYVGSLTVTKGVPVLLDAFRRLRGDAELILLGGWATPRNAQVSSATASRRIAGYGSRWAILSRSFAPQTSSSTRATAMASATHPWRLLPAVSRSS